MNKYESVIIVNPNLDEAGVKALEDKFTGLINENGKVESVENMGKKRLAYEIKKCKLRFSKSSKSSYYLNYLAPKYYPDKKQWIDCQVVSAQSQKIGD